MTLTDVKFLQWFWEMSQKKNKFQATEARGGIPL
jgi:hypothetical protein